MFVWTIQNNSGEKRTVSLTFTFKNGTGSKEDGKTQCSSQTFSSGKENLSVKGVALEHDIAGIQTTYGVAAVESVSA